MVNVRGPIYMPQTSYQHLRYEEGIHSHLKGSLIMGHETYRVFHL
jgi:hypothetical protein